MPPVIIGVAAGLGAAAAGTTIFGLSVTFSAILIGAGTAALNLAQSALTPKPKSPSFSFVESERGFQTLIRSSVEPQRIIYGERVVSGPMVFAATSDTNNSRLHLVIPLAGHRVHEIGSVFLNNEEITPDQIGGDGWVIAGRYTNLVRIKKHLGTEDQVADADLVAEVDEWTEDHRGIGIAYIYVTMIFNRDVFPTGIPNVRATVKGRLMPDWRDTPVPVVSSSVAGQTVITTQSNHGLSVGQPVFIWGHTGSDPEIRGEYQVLSTPTPDSITIRTDVSVAGTGGSLLPMSWSDNLPLAISDYAVSDFGPKDEPEDDFSLTDAVAAVNIADETVALSSSTPTLDFTADDATDLLTQADPANNERYKPLHFADGVELATTGTLPAPLAALTTYYAVPTGDSTFKLAATLADARDGNAIDITSPGSGTHTLTRKSQQRYTGNGVVSLDQRPIDVLPDMISAMGGAMVFTQGQDKLYAGAYTGPASVQLDESQLRAPIRWRKAPPKRELFNVVKGEFVDRDNFWQPNEFKSQRSTAAITEDGGEDIVDMIELPFVTDQARSQRLARLHLQRARDPLTVDYPANLSALELAVMDTVDLSIDLLGFVEKEFVVLGWSIGEEGGVNLALKETDPGLYTWDPDTDEVIVNRAANTNLPDPFTVAPPTSLQLFSGTNELDVRLDGTVFSRIRATWTQPTDHNVLNGGAIELAYRKSGGQWRPTESVRGDETEWFALDVADGESYDVAARSINRLGVRSDTNDDPSTWQALVTGHVVQGKTDLPSAPTSLRAFQNGATVLFRITNAPSADFDHYDLRFQKRGAGLSFADQTPVDDQTLRREMTTVSVAPGDWTFEVRSVDTSGNVSATGATADLVVANFQNVVLAVEQRPTWSGLGAGSSTGFVRNPLTGNLNPSSDDSASTIEELFSAYAFNPPAQGIYETTEIDIGGDTDSRIWGVIDSNLGPGETGVADPMLEIDYRTSAESFDGFEEWAIGSVNARYVKARFVADFTKGITRITGFELAIDIDDRQELAGNVPIAIAGTAIVFERPFLQEVNVEVTNVEDAARFVAATNVTLNGFTAKVWDSAGVPVAGTINWRAEGA